MLGLESATLHDTTTVSPALVPFLLDAARAAPASPGDGESEAPRRVAELLGLSRDARALPALAPLLAAPGLATRTEAALALARLGDPRGAGWLGDALRRESDVALAHPVLPAVARLRDTAHVPLVLALLDREAIAPHAAAALASYRSAAVWRRTLAHPAAGGAARATLLAMADSVALDDPSARLALGELTLGALRGPGEPGARWPAVRLAARLRDPRAIAPLVELLLSPSVHEPAASALVRLTGWSGAPLAAEEEEGRARAAGAWRRWLAAGGATVVVPEAEGRTRIARLGGAPPRRAARDGSAGAFSRRPRRGATTSSVVWPLAPEAGGVHPSKTALGSSPPGGPRPPLRPRCRERRPAGAAGDARAGARARRCDGAAAPRLARGRWSSRRRRRRRRSRRRFLLGDARPARRRPRCSPAS